MTSSMTATLTYYPADSTEPRHTLTSTTHRYRPWPTVSPTRTALPGTIVPDSN
jgi:hypothetical protein